MSATCALVAGKVNPDTERRNWLAIFARLPMLSAVAVEPDEVCVVICWITFIVREI